MQRLDRFKFGGLNAHSFPNPPMWTYLAQIECKTMWSSRRRSPQYIWTREREDRVERDLKTRHQDSTKLSLSKSSNHLCELLQADLRSKHGSERVCSLYYANDNCKLYEKRKIWFYNPTHVKCKKKVHRKRFGTCMITALCAWAFKCFRTLQKAQVSFE